MESSLEYILTHSYKEDMISYMKQHPKKIDELIKLAIADKGKYSWRAAWLLWSCMEKNDPRIRKYMDEILKVIRLKEGGHLRELLKVLLQMDLSEEQEGYLFDFSIETWERLAQQPSIRYAAFEMIKKIVANNPELSSEISFLTQDHYLETLSPGIKHSIMKMRDSLKKM